MGDLHPLGRAVQDQDDLVTAAGPAAFGGAVQPVPALQRRLAVPRVASPGKGLSVGGDFQALIQALPHKSNRQGGKEVPDKAPFACCHKKIVPYAAIACQMGLIPHLT